MKQYIVGILFFFSIFTVAQTIEKEWRFESIKKNTGINQDNINNTNLQVKPLRVKPKRTRVRPTKIKPTKDKTKKGFMGIFKGKSIDKDEPEKDSEKE